MPRTTGWPTSRQPCRFRLVSGPRRSAEASPRAEPPDLCRRGDAVAQLDAVGEPIELLVRRLALDLGLVRFSRLFVARPFIGDGELVEFVEEDAGGVRVETPHGNDAALVADEPDHRRAAPCGSRAVVTPAGFFKDVHERLGATSVPSTSTRSPRSTNVELARLAVHRDAAGPGSAPPEQRREATPPPTSGRRSGARRDCARPRPA